jgi:hypothetical protein
MPCRCDDYPTDPTVPEVYYEKVRRELDRVTQFLCFMCGETEYAHYFGSKSDQAIDLPDRLQEWREKHQESDRIRVARQMKKDLGGKRKYKDSATMAEAYIKKAEKVHPVSRFHKAWFQKLAHAAFAIDDAIREKKKSKAELRRAALNKLTPEERELLKV